MDIPKQSRADRYESFYREFDSPLMQKIRRETFGEDIGLHSWGSAQEMRTDIARLNLSSSSRIVDLGCGPCGPLTFILATAGCRGTGIELSPSALRAGQARARSLGVESLLSVQEGDLNESLPFPARSFDAAVSIDVVLHLRDRPKFFRDVANILRPAADFYLPMPESLLVPSQTKMSATAVPAVIPNSSRPDGTRDSSSPQDCAFWRLRIGRRAYLGTPHKD